MSNQALAVVALVALAGCTPFQREVVAESVFTTITVLDWGQTNGITQRCREGNTLIGDCGQNVSPNLYFPTMIGLHVLATWLIPRDWRGLFQGVSIGTEMRSTYRNWRLGDGQVW